MLKVLLPLNKREYPPKLMKNLCPIAFEAFFPKRNVKRDEDKISHATKELNAACSLP
jgi:hypothetical protein